MNKLIRLSHSGIEYLDYVWNFYSGCWNWKNGICPVEKCWARGITERFKRNYPNGFEPTYYSEAFLSPLYLKKPSIIGVAFMGDLFGDWVDADMKFHSSMPSGKASLTMSLKGWITTTIKQCPQHTFLFLTKCPQNLIQFSPFPENCWVGVSVTGNSAYYPLLCNIGHSFTRVDATIKFISFEPLLENLLPSAEAMASDLKSREISWIIIGAQTKPYKPPKIEWVRQIVEAADRAGIPVFLKDNILELVNYKSPETEFAFNKDGYYRQEMPGK